MVFREGILQAATRGNGNVTNNVQYMVWTTRGIGVHDRARSIHVIERCGGIWE